MASTPRFHLEDFTLGRAFPLPPHTVTREEIIAFAREFDPQPFHLGDGGNGLSDGLTASGWHTCAIFMRALCDGLLLDSACLGSPGIDYLRWLKPVRPGDTLTAIATVIEARASKSRPDRGIVRFRHDVANQGGEAVLTMENPILFLARPAS
jgi:acyl dehydratase